MIVYEKQRFGQTPSFDVIETENFSHGIQHFHRNYELIYVSCGEMLVLLDGEEIPLQADEFLMIFPNQIHSFQAGKDTKQKLYIFSPNYISIFYETFLNKLPLHKIFKMAPDGKQFVLGNLRKEADAFTIKACLYAVCSEIVRQTEFYDIPADKNRALTHRFLEYIAMNYEKPLSLKAVALQLGYNHQYLSRYINRRFSMSFSDLLNAYRINRAVYLLESTDQSITTIAYECGFDNIRSFNRNFSRILSKTPREYRGR